MAGGKELWGFFLLLVSSGSELLPPQTQIQSNDVSTQKTIEITRKNKLWKKGDE